MRNAARISAATFGVIVGIAGFEHGLGECLQGNVPPPDTNILSWPNSPVFHILGGEPAMTVLPDLLVTGILAMFVSVAIIVWSLGHIQRRFGGLALIVLSILLLPVGGGYAPPVLGVITGLAALGINARFTWLRQHLPIGAQAFSAMLWPWMYAICLAAWLMLLPGLLILGYFFGVDDPTLVVSLSFSVLVTLVLTFLTSYGYNIYQYSRADLQPWRESHSPSKGP